MLLQSLPNRLLLGIRQSRQIGQDGGDGVGTKRGQVVRSRASACLSDCASAILYLLLRNPCTVEFRNLRLILKQGLGVYSLNTLYEIKVSVCGND
jgi:hypothetical protein